MPIVGERKTVSMGQGFKKDPMFRLAQSFNETTQNILNESGIDVLGDAPRSLRMKSSLDALQNFFIKESADPASMDMEEYEEHVQGMKEMFLNDVEGFNEYANLGDYNPIIGIMFPMHKNLLMNCVFDKALPKFVAKSPKFTLTMETRYLVTPDGREIDMYTNQMDISKEMKKVVPYKEVAVALPELGTTDIVAGIGGSSIDHLSIVTSISAVKVEVTAETAGETVEENGKHYRWVPVDFKFKPNYGEYDRSFMEPVDLSKVADLNGSVTDDVLSAAMHKDRFHINAFKGVIVGVKINAKIDSSNGLTKTCAVKWGSKTDLVEIPEATPISVAIAPEEVKDIAALYNVNQLTKLMSMINIVLENVKDDGIKDELDRSLVTMDPNSKVLGKFDFEPRQGYALDDVEWRHKTFFDTLDTFATEMYSVLNDPNVSITVLGRPDLIRKITPTEYSYQAPSSIGPVELNYNKTVVSSDKRVYNFMSSQKLENTNELTLTLHPRNTDRIIYRIYDYQMYASNEIRNATYHTLPGVTAFERWKFESYQPVQGRIEILNPSKLLIRD